MSDRPTSERDVQSEVTVTLTANEARGLRMACIFGVPTPTPPEIESACKKLREAEAETPAHPPVPKVDAR